MHYLIENHPDYQDVQIDADKLSALPIDDTILDQVPCINNSNIDEENIEEADQMQEDTIDDDNFLVDSACVPDITNDFTETAFLQK